jgi:adsorption protein B
MVAMHEEILFWFWLSLRGLMLGLIFLFLFSGLDDLFVDIVYYWRKIYRALFKRKYRRPLTQEQLSSVPEKPLAIMVPAWDESTVIKAMLLNTVGTIQYRNYHIFVGFYANDGATEIAVGEVSELYPQVQGVLVPHDGPTNKADCLNWVFQGIKTYEEGHDIRFEALMLHDAEDVIHPLSLKFFNYLIPRFHFIQLPVFPLATRWFDFVTGTYMDEFAESHTKELRTREFIATTLPSAGVGTAVSREAMDYLAEDGKNQIFDITSLTEDYMFGLRLSRFTGRKMFLQQTLSVGGKLGLVYKGGRRPSEPLATRELFPHRFSDAVRQKSRWILGITLQGWRAGWGSTLGDAYYLFRDRKSIVTNLAVFFGYLLVLVSAAVWGLNELFGIRELPPLVGNENVVYVVAFRTVIVLLLWRIFNRVVASMRIYGPLHGLLAIPRLVYGNYLNFVATCVAIRRYVRSRVGGETPGWEKTAHAFPSDEQLRKYHRKLGDLLVDFRMVSVDQLAAALTKQAESGRPLGEILVQEGVIWEEDLVFALAKQKQNFSVEIDPYGVPPAVLALVPKRYAVVHRVFPISQRDGLLVVATDRPDLNRVKIELEERLKLKLEVDVRPCGTVDMGYALRNGYADHSMVPASPDDRLGRKLVLAGAITTSQLQDAVRSQKRSNQPLGNILEAAGAISSERLAEELAKK